MHQALSCPLRTGRTAAMDKFLVKKSSSKRMDRQSLGASAAGASEVIDVDARQPSGGGSKRTPRSGRTRSRKIVDDDDDDFEVPNAKTPTKRKTPPKRKTKAKKEENVAEDEPAAAPATKNGKRKAKAKKEEATVASASGGGGGALAFGGGDLPEDGVAPPPKKKWAGKPKDDPPNRGRKNAPRVRALASRECNLSSRAFSILFCGKSVSA